VRTPISRSFLRAHPREFLVLGQIASEWKCRPSELVNGSIGDFQFDFAGAVALWREREKRESEIRSQESE